MFVWLILRSCSSSESVDARIKAVEKMREAVQLERATAQQSTEPGAYNHSWPGRVPVTRLFDTDHRWNVGQVQTKNRDRRSTSEGEKHLRHCHGQNRSQKFTIHLLIVLTFLGQRLLGLGNYQVPDSLSRNGGSWSF